MNICFYSGGDTEWYFLHKEAESWWGWWWIWKEAMQKTSTTEGGEYTEMWICHHHHYKQKQQGEWSRRRTNAFWAGETIWAKEAKAVWFRFSPIRDGQTLLLLFLWQRITLYYTNDSPRTPRTAYVEWYSRYVEISIKIWCKKFKPTNHVIELQVYRSLMAKFSTPHVWHANMIFSKKKAKKREGRERRGEGLSLCLLLTSRCLVDRNRWLDKNVRECIHLCVVQINK